MIVIDASVAVDLVLNTGSSESIRRRIAAERPSLHAPHRRDVEVAQVLRRYHRAGELSPTRGRAALDDLADLRLRRYPHSLVLPRAWELRGNLSAYDAVYVALAELLTAQLWTRDARLARAPGHRAQVTVV